MGRQGFIERLISRKLLLPPLAGYTNYPFRLILAEFHPPSICTEMVSPFAVIHQSVYAEKILRRAPGNHYNGVQLVGRDLDAMGEAAVRLEELGFDYIDINMGCIVNKVTRIGGGASLLRNEDEAHLVARAVVDAVDVPVTCKIRLGSSREKLNAAVLVKRLAEAGVSAVTIHGRTGERKFGEQVNHAAIREAVEASPVPVVANGGIYTGEDAARMLELTGAAAVMPARGLIGNPWLIPEIESAVSGSAYEPPTVEERREVCLRHLGYLVDHGGDEEHAVILFRRTLPEYFRGCWNLKELRQRSHEATTVKEVQEMAERIHQEGDHMNYRVEGSQDPRAA